MIKKTLKTIPQTYDGLADELHKKAQALVKNKQLWIGLAGSPGSGKSTLAIALQQRLESDLLVIPMDGYHYYRKELDAMRDPIEAHMRRGTPFTFNSKKFLNDLLVARSSGEGHFPSFDHHIADPIENDIYLSNEYKIVLVEGNYLLLNSEPWSRLKKDVFDETWYLDVSIEECKRRLINRHIEVGLSEEQAQLRVIKNDAINAELVAKQSPNNADRMIFIPSIMKK